MARRESNIAAVGSFWSVGDPWHRGDAASAQEGVSAGVPIVKRRIPRIPVLFTLSSLLLVAIGVLWLRSVLHHADGLILYGPTGTVNGVIAGPSGILFCSTNMPAGRDMALGAQAVSMSPDELEGLTYYLMYFAKHGREILGVRFGAGTFGPTIRFHLLVIPYWLCAAVLAIPSLWKLCGVVLRLSRTRPGYCPGCGYDLRCSEGRCPECGRPIRPREAIAARRPIAPAPERSARAAFASWAGLALAFAVPAVLLVRGHRAAGRAATAPVELAVLDREFDGTGLAGRPVPPADWAAALARGSGEPVRIDWGAASHAAMRQTPLDLGTIHHATVGALLRQLRDQVVPEADPRLEVWADREAVQLGPATSAPHVLRSYPVQDLLRDVAPEVKRAYAIEHSINYGPLHSGPRASVEMEMDDAIQDFIATFIDLGDWWMPTGGGIATAGSPAVAVLGGRAWVWQTQAGHASIRQMLAALRATGAKPPVTDAAGPGLDSAVIPELNLNPATLGTAIDALRKATGANLWVDWDDLAEDGIKRNAPITLRLHRVTLRQALTAALGAAGGEGPAGFNVRDDLIVVATAYTIREHAAVLRAYDIRDLMTNADPGAERLVNTIEKSVDPDSWRVNGGTIGNIRVFAGRLVIWQTPENHRNLAAFLKTVRGNNNGH